MRTTTMRTTTTSIWNFETPPSGPRPAHPKIPYRLQPLFCVNISHYLKYVRSKFAGLSYERGRATVFSHFGCRALQWAARPGRSRRYGFCLDGM